MHGKSKSPVESRYLDRELSWIEFNRRVLEEAQDPSVPLLERVRFLAITASNLDEFVMVRVGGLQSLLRQAPRHRQPSGMTVQEQLAAVRQRIAALVQEQYRLFHDVLLPELRREGIDYLPPAAWNARQFQDLRSTFYQELYPVLTPMAVPPEEVDAFPLLGGRQLNLLVHLAGESAPRRAIIPLGPRTRRILTLQAQHGYAFTLVEDVVRHFVQEFFSGEDLRECVAFRITRNADLELQEDQAADLMEEMEELLDARKTSHCVRLEMEQGASTETRQWLQQVLQVDPQDVYVTPGPLDLSAFGTLADLPGPSHLKYPPWPPLPSPHVDPAVPMVENLARRDILLCHPYESFDPVVRLVSEAADDPDVLAIKQTLYRTSRDSPFVEALCRAARNGKYVTALVELRARFDEERNIHQAQALERSGAQVVYGVRGLKTHAKVCMIVRREPHGIQRYVHFGTGNYNEQTARIYSDISLLTRDEAMGSDATALFHALTGYSQPQPMQRLESAPMGLRERLLELIEAEVLRQRQGLGGQITAKVNSLVDPQIIDALYEASRAGVQIRLNVRGICCLRPGVPGLSENIEVISIVDRFLEHARILYFYHGGEEKLYIASADWMPRNLDRRIELLIPVIDETCRMRLRSILETYFRDNVKARRLLPDGTYQRITPPPGGTPFRAQEALYRMAQEAQQQALRGRRTVFQPYVPEEDTG